MVIMQRLDSIGSPLLRLLKQLACWIGGFVSASALDNGTLVHGGVSRF
jgi:hypothetical protein